MAALRPDPLDTGAADAMSSAAAQATPRPGRYEIDTSCSAVTFTTRHLFGLAPVRGSFAIRAATIDVAEPVTDSSIHAEIDTASFRTGNGQRDVTVHSARLLDAVRYPVITFISEGAGGPALPGMLTVRGVTPLRIVARRRAKDPWPGGGHQAPAEACDTWHSGAS